MNNREKTVLESLGLDFSPVSSILWLWLVLCLEDLGCCQEQCSPLCSPGRGLQAGSPPLQQGAAGAV